MPVNKFLQKNGDGGEGFIEWDAESGLIMSDSGGEYKVCNTLFDARNPDSNGKTTRSFGVNNSESMISYKKPEYKYAQVWGYSASRAIKTTQDPDTGEETRTSYIGSPGKASMKIRKIEKRLAGEKDWKLTLSKIYDENGNLIREIDADGNLKEFIYDKKNRHIKTYESGILIYKDSGEHKDGIISLKSISDKYSIKKTIRNGIVEIFVVDKLGNETKIGNEYNE